SKAAPPPAKPETPPAKPATHAGKQVAPPAKPPTPSAKPETPPASRAPPPLEPWPEAALAAAAPPKSAAAGAAPPEPVPAAAAKPVAEAEEETTEKVLSEQPAIETLPEYAILGEAVPTPPSAPPVARPGWEAPPLPARTVDVSPLAFEKALELLETVQDRDSI